MKNGDRELHNLINKIKISKAESCLVLNLLISFDESQHRIPHTTSN